MVSELFQNLTHSVCYHSHMCNLRSIAAEVGGILPRS